MLFAVVAMFGFGTYALAPVHTEEDPVPEADLQAEVKLTGESVCLPHKNPGEMQTMECAYGLQVDDKYYALDLGSFIMDFQTGETVNIEGTFVPLEALSSDQWQKYDIEGIVTVTAIMN